MIVVKRMEMITLDRIVSRKVSLGQLVRTLVEEEQYSKEYKVEWDGRNDFGGLLSPGIYFYTLKIGSNTIINKKMILLR